MTVSAQYEKYGGVYYAYQAPSVQPPAPPKGYHPFYISHYGRHGSRWMPKENRYTWLAEQFADESNLTAAGLELKRRMQPALDNARGNAGALTPLGAKQHRQIARRLFKRCKDVLGEKGVHVSARSSTSPRCKASMNAFCDELRQLNPRLDIVEETDQRYMYYIAYTSPEEEALEHDTVVKCAVTGDRLAAVLYKNPTLQTQQDKLLSELHTLASSMQDVELPLSFWDIFTEAEIRAIYDMNNTRMRLVNGIDPWNLDIPARCAVSLWRNIVETADSVIALGGDERSATLRFGHDTCLYHLFSLLGLYDGVPNLMDELLPMAANLQLIFFRNMAGDVIVQVLHNERSIALPGIPRVEDSSHPFYHWTDVKAHYQHWLDEDLTLQRLNTLNTFTGTAPSETKTAGLFGKKTEEFGQTLPAVLAPNGMNAWTPQTQPTEKKCVAPYYYLDKEFQGFRNSHWIVGGCTQDYGSFTLKASLNGEAVLPLDHTQEVSHPHYYRLHSGGLIHEMTATSRAAIFRFTVDSAPGTPPQSTLVTLTLTANSDEGESFISIDSDQHRLYAENPVHRIYQGWGEPAGFSGYYVLEWKNELVDSYVNDSVAVLTFQLKADEPLMVKAASSFCNAEGAVRNLNTEIPHWDFLHVYGQLQQRWLDQFSLIEVEAPLGDTNSEKFYSALYRASFLPREFSDVDGCYPAFACPDSLTYNDGVSYMDFSLWDTYRALHPLLNLIAPQKSAAMVRSLVRMAEQGGWMPIFPCWNSYTAAMIGDHTASVIADAWVKGVRDFDLEKAYKYLRKNAFETPDIDEYEDGKGRRALQSYLDYGYIPIEDEVKEAFHTNEQTARTLEYAYDDFCLLQLAKALAEQSDALITNQPNDSSLTSDIDDLQRRSGYWRNVINPSTGYADGRRQDGTFLGSDSPFEKQIYITEGAPCHYTWYVPHDPEGLIAVMGGRDAFVSKLDSMFTEGRYWHGNEPCHQVPYMFNYADEAWRTQQYVRHILDTEYLNTPGGLSGNDDAGQMSAWLVFSMMGLYPVCPGTPYYQIGSPVFPRVVIRQHSGQAFVVEAENASPENIFIQRAELNGKPYEKKYLHHDDIVRGGVLHLVMGPR